jgi:bifunctional non-homologous end joining protein LigD
MASLREYRTKRDPDRTPEPMPAEPAEPAGATGPARQSSRTQATTFVVQEHHASALHWDFRLERDGVLVSWAVPKGVPPDPKVNHLAVHVEDHPLEYASFEGTIAEGEYGGGRVTIWDSGTYETEKWTDREVKVILHGERVQGRFVLFQTRGKNWMIHRMDAPARPDWQPLPERLSPMLATRGSLPPGRGWAFEMKWDGIRALIRVEGGRIAVALVDERDITASLPELRALGEVLGTTQVLLDGELVSFDDSGHPSADRLGDRIRTTSPTAVRRSAAADPAVFLIFDLLHMEGRSLLPLPYAQRRELLLGLELGGEAWQTPPAFAGSGRAAVAASRKQGLGGVVAKRADSIYTPGLRSREWVAVKNTGLARSNDAESRSTSPLR